MKNLQNKSVLVIGWEYPPRMVGGLAIATHGIVKALSNFISVKLIIPFKDEQTPEDDNVIVYGLNAIKDDLDSEEWNSLMSKMVDLEWSQGISAYPSVTKIDRVDSHKKLKATKRMNHLSLFESDEVYGLGLWEKMNAFKEAVTLLSKHISFDIIHCHDWVTFSAGIEVKQATDKPLVLHVHALETDRMGPSAHNEIYRIEKEAMELSDVIFPVSAYTKQCIIDNYGISEAKIVPIHNAIDHTSIQRWRHRIPQKIVTFLGRITLQKGPNYLLETIQKVVRIYKNIRFVIAGSGDMLSDLLMHSAYAQLSRYMIFTGFIKRNQVNALLATSDVYFMPSVSEPFGLTALEAARAGVACVITKQSGAAEVLPSALKADFWDTDKFASQIIDLVQNDGKRAHVAKKQQEEMRRVSWTASAEKIVAEYYEILN